MSAGKSQMNRILVTGANGFIGCHICKLLIISGFEVHGVSRTAPSGAQPNGMIVHTADLLTAGAPTALVRNVRPSHLLHLAWSEPKTRALMKIENVEWISASHELFRAFIEADGRRAVFAGSFAEYDWDHETLHETRTPARARTLYGAAKNAVRELVEISGRESSVSTAWARISWVYGPHEPRGRLVSDVASDLLSGRKVETTAGQQERDFIHVVDVARALEALLIGDVRGIVNVASGQCVPVRMVVEILGQLAGRSDLLAIGAKAMPANEPLRLAADVNRLRVEMGFVARYPLEEGLAATLDWWRAHAAAE
jgi:nucleoside-diphosphate-sugar epimerase